ncbi:MAG: DUF4153 domain-containing protein [Thiolinea sp.]
MMKTSLTPNTEAVRNHSAQPTETPALWLFALFGALSGLLIGQLIIFADMEETFHIISFFALLSIALSFRKNQGRLNILALVVFNSLVLLAFLLWSSKGYLDAGRNSSDVIFLFTAIAAITIVTTFLQAWHSSKPHIRYDSLFEHAWNDTLIVKMSVLFMLAFLLVLLLGTALFENIGIDWPDDIIWNKNITPVIVGTLLGLGVCICRRYHAVIFRIRLLIFALLQIMAIFTALLVIAFIFSLPFTLDTLFENRGTSNILLTLCALSILLINTLTDKGSAQLPRWQNSLFMLHIVLLPLLPLISLYALNLRIEQYGLMPERLIAFLLAALLAVYSLSYLLGLVLRRAKWSLALERYNPPLALLSLGISVLVLSTVINPVEISINQQLSRLKNNEVSVEKFDFHTLKHRMGQPGVKALETINSWDTHPQINDIRAAIKTAKRHLHNKVKLEIVPDAALPDNIKSLADDLGYQCRNHYHCLVKLLPIGGDGNKQVVVFSFTDNKNYLSTFIYQHNGANWQIVKSYNRSRAIIDGQYPVIVDNIRRGNIDILQPDYLDFRIDSIEFR